MNIAKIKLLFPYITLKRGGSFFYTNIYSPYSYTVTVSRDYVLCITKQTHRTEHPMCTDNVNLIFDSFFFYKCCEDRAYCVISFENIYGRSEGRKKYSEKVAVTNVLLGQDIFAYVEFMKGHRIKKIWLWLF